MRAYFSGVIYRSIEEIEYAEEEMNICGGVSKIVYRHAKKQRRQQKQQKLEMACEISA
jgi:hypothetical protein